MTISQFQGKHRFLSNFWPAKVTFGGWEYPTVEHAYQAAKTISMNDRRRIQEAQTPGEAKKIGQTVLMREGWEFMKVWVMYELVRNKFIPYDMHTLLNNTGDEELLEGNNWGDKFWGVTGDYLSGDNWLGRILMSIRQEHKNV